MANEIIKGIGFHHIGLKTADLAKSVKFYEALGMKEIVRWGEGEKEIVMLDIGDGGRFELFANGGDEFSENGKFIHFAMKVDDVPAAYAHALSVGALPHVAPKIVPLDSKPEKITIEVAFVKGPDGEQLEFFREH
ncbi:MAG: VOC family protein [Ruminococcaceae bacterium]|nr:VOC family protein [Oscillospiraceae bacterium]